MEDETGDKGRLDLSAYEKDGRFLEGTGSLVLDRIHRIAYISRSERSDIDLAHLWAKKMGSSILSPPILYDYLCAVIRTWCISKRSMPKVVQSIIPMS